MKLTAIILLAACLQVSARSGAQTITLSEKNASLEKVFKEIKKQSGYSFLYSSEVLKQSRPVNVELRNATLIEALNACFSGQPYNWEIEGRTVIVKPKQAEEKKEETLLPIEVKGRVVNEKGEPVEGVTVTIKGTKTVTTTNSNGDFFLNSVEPNATLVFTHVSLETFELKVSGRTELAISLKTKISALSDVTVEVNTGYQKIPKVRATGSFGLVNSERLNRKAGTEILSRLEGVTTGVLFDRRSLQSTENGVSQANILIRGISTLTEDIKALLIIVDHFPYDGDISNINPNDVERIYWCSR